MHGYEEWGDTCFDKFNGMFGIALHDKKKKRTLLVRDHFGIKPLYFTQVSLRGATGDAAISVNGIASSVASLPSRNDIVIFSSEIKPLIYSGLIPVETNDRIIYRYLKYRIHDDGRETFFKGVERLLPGEMMVIDQVQSSKI